MNAPIPSDAGKSDAVLPFARRHVGLSLKDEAAMLEAVGAPNMETFIAETVPAPIRQSEPLPFGPGLSETEALERIGRIANKNTVFTSLIGQGYHGTHLPPVIQRNILENPMTRRPPRRRWPSRGVRQRSRQLPSLSMRTSIHRHSPSCGPGPSLLVGP